MSERIEHVGHVVHADVVEHAATVGSTTIKPLVVHRGIPWSIVVSFLAHITIGVCLLIRPANANLLLFSGLDSLANFFGVGAYAVAIALILLGLLAMVGWLSEGRIPVSWSTGMVTPQYAMMLWSGLSDILIIIGGENPTTHMPLDRSLIVMVFTMHMALVIGHTGAFIERYVWRWMR